MNDKYRKDFIITVFGIFCMIGSVLSYIFITDIFAKVFIGSALMIVFFISLHFLSCNKKDVRVSYINNIRNDNVLSPVEVITTRI